MIGKLLALIVGGLLLFGALGIFASIVVSGLIVLVLALTLIGRRDWVPVVYNFRSLGVRKVSTSLTALGLALVVFVFATMLMLAAGIRKTLVSTGGEGNAKILRKGAQSEVQSGIQPDQVRVLSASPEVAIGADGQPLVSPELVALIFATHENPKSDQDGSNVTIRGVGPKAFLAHEKVKLDGRQFAPGTSEIVIGKALVGQFAGMRAGGSVHFARRDWTVVGVMDSGGSGFDSEIWGDVDQMEDALQRRGAYSSLTVRLRDRADLQPLQARVAADVQTNSLETSREVDYYEKQSEGLSLFITILGVFVAVIFSLGAALGTMITMYSQVAARTREIGVLRALGFRRRSVLISFLVESLLLALLAGAVGVAGASLWRFVSFSTMNFQSFSEVTFQFVLTPKIIVQSLVFAMVMGYAGGLLPAVRAARLPIIDATRGG
jgi:putative ABC transport system permease protein